MLFLIWGRRYLVVVKVEFVNILEDYFEIFCFYLLDDKEKVLLDFGNEENFYFGDNVYV